MGATVLGGGCASKPCPAHAASRTRRERLERCDMRPEKRKLSLHHIDHALPSPGESARATAGSQVGRADPTPALSSVRGAGRHVQLSAGARVTGPLLPQQYDFMTIRHVRLGLAMAILVSCGGHAAVEARAEFAGMHMCPRERITVTPRHDLSARSFVQSPPPPANVSSDPGRMAMWDQLRQQADVDADTFTVYDVDGCGQHDRYLCRDDMQSDFQGQCELPQSFEAWRFPPPPLGATQPSASSSAPPAQPPQAGSK